MQDHEAAVETDVWRDLMPLVEHCSAVARDRRPWLVPGVLVVSTVGEVWVIEVIDPNTNRSFSVYALTLDEAFKRTAELLRIDSPPYGDSCELSRFIS